MSDERPPPLASYLEPEVSQARIARNRAAIEARLARPWWLSLRVAGVGALAVAVAVAVVIAWPSAHVGPSVWSAAAGERVRTTERVRSVALLDGTVVALAAHSSIRGIVNRAAEVAMELESGGAVFDVTRNPARAFVVHAGAVEVRVLGTRFRVSRTGDRVSVDVERGRVEVRVRDDRSVLGAGDHWSSDEHMLERGAAAQVVPAHVPAPRPAEIVEPTPPSPVVGTNAPRAQPHATRPGQPPDDVAGRTLFEAAQAARREGNPQRAAALFGEIVAQHSSDPRAGLAAFELGRIRADVLHDVPGAIAMLERAQSLSPYAAYREDAQARLVSLYERSGNGARCRAERAEYLRDHPAGVHRDEVTSHCP